MCVRLLGCESLGRGGSPSATERDHPEQQPLRRLSRDHLNTGRSVSYAELVGKMDADDFRRELLLDMAEGWNAQAMNASKSPRHR